ncbi:MAG: hypothetical protein ABIQ57_00540 [Candidatus Kapaibacterium sp.]
MLIPFSKIFRTNEDKSLTTKVAVQIAIGGVVITLPAGASITELPIPGGIDLESLRSKEIEAEKVGNLLVISGIH